MSLTSDLVQTIQELDSFSLAEGEEFIEANFERCNAATAKSIHVLDEVLSSQEFASAIASLNAVREKYVQECRKMIQDERRFRRFLDSEQQILLGAGVPPSASNSFIEECALLRLQALDEIISPIEVFRSVYVIRVKLQKVKPDLNQTNFIERLRKWNWRNIFTSTTLGLGGIALVTLNETVLKGTPVVGALSGKFGELLVAFAATKVVNVVGPG